MPDPAYLPAELFKYVIDRASSGDRDVKSLCDMSLVDRYWHATVSTRIYPTWTFDGDIHSIKSLWNFLRTILSSPRIAKQVRTLNIRNWTFGLSYAHNDASLSEQNIEMVRSAILKAGLQPVMPMFMDGLYTATPEPLMALVLAHLPDLTTLYADIAETDTFFVEVLRHGLEHRENGSQALQNLQEAHLAGTWTYGPNNGADDYYRLDLENTWPLFRLPQIREVSVFDLYPYGAAVHFGGFAKTSDITHMTIVHQKNWTVQAPDLCALLALPKALSSLSIYLHDTCLLEDDPVQISNADIWLALSQQQSCIEHLDIYRDCVGRSPATHSPENSHFGSLDAFERLKSLSVQPEMLLGGCCGDVLAPFRLKDTLPPNIESLTLYGEEGLSTNKSLGNQVQEVLASPTFPRLNHVVLEKPSYFATLYPDPADPPHPKVSQACRESGVNFEIGSGKKLVKGGKGRRYYKSTRKMRMERLPKMVAVQRANAQRERKLQNASSALDQSAVPLDEQDSFDLSFYELFIKHLAQVNGDLGGESDRLDEDELDADELDVDELDAHELDTYEMESNEQESDESTLYREVWDRPPWDMDTEEEDLF